MQDLMPLESTVQRRGTNTGSAPAAQNQDGAPHVCVAGGGLLGMVLALRLAQHGYRVTLLEAEPRGGEQMTVPGLHAVGSGSGPILHGPPCARKRRASRRACRSWNRSGSAPAKGGTAPSVP